ncbi:MAG: hypothetical protein CM1200mP30_04150 [Pseudomonadota bacterium]|nr:MAG: hypothetical protein CM1200mP30_04150 [Pseudomonadota bacterium]|tara:strand:+ start:346 stop:543 length:198 start_codon:yes stop_codon:yes gene_type:complete
MFMSTGIESWTPIKEVTVLSPFSGSEYVLTIIVVAIWIVWHIWQIKSENSTYEEQTSKLQGNPPN